MKLLEEGYLVQEARYISRIKEAVNDLFVFADGTITLLDYPGAIGCIKGGSFFNIWFSPAYCLLRMKAKKIRYHKKLECISFCRGCDKKSIIEQDIQYKYCHG
jgi:hypothetical protein